MKPLRSRVYVSPSFVHISLDSHSIRVCCSGNNPVIFTDPKVERLPDIDDDESDGMFPDGIADYRLLSKDRIFPSNPF